MTPPDLPINFIANAVPILVEVQTPDPVQVEVTAYQATPKAEPLPDLFTIYQLAKL